MYYCVRAWCVQTNECCSGRTGGRELLMYGDAYDVVIIGAGIIGLSTGYYLQRAGSRVLLLDKGGFGGGSSGACDDMILLQSKKPGTVLTLAFESLEMYRGLSRELNTDIEFSSMGGTIFIESQRDLSIMEEFVTNQRSCGLNVDIIDRKALIKKQPYIRESIFASTYSPSDSQADPFRVMYGFLRKGMSLGMEVRYHEKVIGLDRSGSGYWLTTASSGKTYTSPVVINAAGAWAGIIGTMIGLDIPINPKRGQLVITEKTPSFGETNAWTAEYLVTKLKPELAVSKKGVDESLGLSFSISRTADGNYMIGSTREYVGFDKGTTYDATKRIVQQASSIFPVLKNVHIIRTISGFRPASMDGKMILGEHTEQPGFFTVAGHEGDGIAMAPVTGALASRLVRGSGDTDVLKEFSPDRFAASGSNQKD